MIKEVKHIDFGDIVAAALPGRSSPMAATPRCGNPTLELEMFDDSGQ